VFSARQTSPEIYRKEAENLDPFFGHRLSSSCHPSVCLPPYISADAIGWISLEFDVGDYHGNPNLVKIRQNYRAVNMKTSGRLIMSGDINSPWMQFLCNVHYFYTCDSDM